jgi:hypothetical protein
MVTGASFPSAWTVTDSTSLTWTKQVDNTDGQQIWTATTPASAVVTNSFEGGTDGTAISTTNSGGTSGTAFDSLGGSATLPVFSSAGAIHGSLGAYTPLSGNSTTTIEWKQAFPGFNSSSIPWYARDYFTITSLPPALVFLMKAQDDVAPQDVWAVGLTTAGKLVIRNRIVGSNPATATTAVALNTPARWESSCSYNGSTYTITLRCFYGSNVEGTTPDETLGPVTISTTDAVDLVAFGAQAATVQTWASPYHDDIGLSATGWLGPVTAGTPVTGTGSIALPKPSVAATGTETISGTGSVTLPKPSVAASGTQTISGTGSVSLPKPSLAGSGTETISGTGSVALPKPSLAASGAETIAGTGSVALPKPRLVAAGTETISGAGSVALPKPSLAATGTETISGTGSVALPKPSVAGSGTETISGTGSVALPKPKVAASGTETISGAGAVSLPKPSVAGTGSQTPAGAIIGTGSIAMPKPSLAATGTVALSNNAEGGTSGTTVTPGNSGGASGNPWDNISIGGAASLTYDNTFAAHGGLSYKVSTGATVTTALAEWNASFGTLTTVYFRMYVYLTTAATPSAFRPFVARSGASHAASVLINGTTLSLSYSPAFNGAGAFTTPVPLNQWVRIEGFITGDASAGAVSASLYTSMDSTDAVETHTFTGLNTTGALTQYWFGQNNSSANSGPFWMDDLAASPIGYIGPVGGPPGVLLTNSAEGVSSGTTVSITNSGGLAGSRFDAVNIGTGAGLTFDNTRAAHGSQSYKVLVGSSSANSIIEWTNSLTAPAVPVTQAWFRIYLYLTAYSTHQLRIVGVRSGTTTRADVALDSTGHVALLNATGGGVKFSTSVVPLNQWFRLEGFFIGDPSVGQIECKMFTSSMDEVAPDETVTSTATVNTGGTINRVDIGNPSSEASYTFWMDDLGMSTSGYIGPAGTPLIPSLFPAFLF